LHDSNLSLQSQHSYTEAVKNGETRKSTDIVDIKNESDYNSEEEKSTVDSKFEQDDEVATNQLLLRFKDLNPSSQDDEAIRLLAASKGNVKAANKAFRSKKYDASRKKKGRDK
jgi:hypothetical protein